MQEYKTELKEIFEPLVTELLVNRPNDIVC